MTRGITLPRRRRGKLARHNRRARRERSADGGSTFIDPGSPGWKLDLAYFGVNHLLMTLGALLTIA